MSYCTVEDVKSYYLGKEFDCDDYLNNTEVNAFIRQEAAMIDIIIKSKYSLPITNNDDLLLLKTINEKLVVGTIDDIFREKMEGDKFGRARNLRKDAKEMLDKLAKGELLLNGTQISTGFKFNRIDSNGDTVKKDIKIADSDRHAGRYDKEKHRYYS